MFHKFHIFILSNLLLICVHIKAIFLYKGEVIDCAGGNLMFIRFFLICWRDVFQNMTWDYNLRPFAWIWETHFWGVLNLFSIIEFWSSALLKWKVARCILRTGCHDDLFTSSMSLAHFIEEIRLYIFTGKVNVTCLLPSY